MRITSSTRRAAALMAASAIGMSAAVLSTTGVASAVPSYTTVTADAALTVPTGTCSIDFVVVGGSGGNSGEYTGGRGASITFSLDVVAGQQFQLSAGTAGDVPLGGLGGGDGADGGAASYVSEVVDEALFPVVVAAGGGGAGSGADGGDAESFGGNAEEPLTNNYAEGGYAGGNDAPGAGGGYGEDAVGGADGAAGVDEEGGDGATGGGGGGGAGWYGGGGGASADVLGGAGGGGGSSYIEDNEDIRLADSQPALAGTPSDGVVKYLYEACASEPTDPSDPSDPDSGDGDQPVEDLPAPTDVGVTVGTSSLTITWNAPADTTGVTGYEAWAQPEGAQSNATTAICDWLTLESRSCVLPVPAGVRYAVAVVTLDDEGYAAGFSGWSDYTAVVPGSTPPSTVPTGDGTLKSSGNAAVGSVDAGGSIVLTGSGYAPFSTVDLFVYSTPRKIGSVVTDANGAFSVTVTLPADLAPGAHHLVAAGIDQNGNPRYLVSPVTVTEAANSLAYTGFSAAPFLIGGLGALAAGAGLMVAGRRRTAA